MDNPFSISNKKIRSRKIAIWSTVLAAITILAILYGEFKAAIVLLLLPVAIWGIVSIFRDPRIGMFTLFVVNYFVMGVSRYIPGPLGMSIDGLLVLTYIVVFIKSVSSPGMLAPANRDLTYLAAIWYLYAIFELFNPEAASRVAWLFAMRGFSLYFLLTVPLTFILLNKREDLSLILKLLSVFTLLALAKGFVQQMGYIDPAEHRWLMEGGAKTHMVAGHLRVFSFFTDAGQFGAAMGYSGVVFTVVAMGLSKGVERWYYGFVAVAAFVGMMISGTRGAIAVPAAALIMYMIISANARHITITAILAASVFVFFKYTYIGDGNYQIRRMRTAFSGRDASLQVRLQNQAKLADYLASRPFGSGIGSAGNWGQRFSPNTFIAQIPTDSWYVAIWAEQGIVGLSLHLFILFYVLIKGVILVRRVNDRKLAFQLKALLCGLAGIVAASYGNGIMGQMPTGVIIYMSMAFIFMAPSFEQQITKNTNLRHVVR